MNIFASTAYRYAEEDRLTNALISVLEHTDRRVLQEFLKLALPEPIEVESELDDATFETQIALSASRPDACIRLPSVELFIETKRGTALDNDQFVRHMEGLGNRHENPVLVALTKAYREPTVVDEVRRDDNAPNIDVGHVSWSDVLGMVEELAPDFAQRSVTGFLLRQFGEYLEHLGYYCFQGLNMDELVDYGECLMKVARHEQTTVKELKRLLKTLAEEVTRSSGLDLDWSIKRFGTSESDKERARFNFLTTSVPAFGEAKNPCFRVLPSLQPDGGLRVMYYFTYSNYGDLPWRSIVEHLEDRRAEIEDHVGPLYRLGQLRPDKLFHTCKIVEPAKLPALLRADEGAVEEVGQTIGSFFAAMNENLMEALTSATPDVRKALPAAQPD